MNTVSPRQTILIVDDEPANIDVLVETLSDYHRKVALNGKRALKIARAEPGPDLILLDIMMPKMGGHEVCRRLQENERTRHIPIIFVTAKNETADEARGFALGAVDYISKPIKTPIVLARVKTHLALRSAYQTLQKQHDALQETEQLRQDVEVMIRHDMKSPINGIIGFADFLRQGKSLPEETLKQFHQHIYDIATRLRDMVNQSTNLVQMERGVYQVVFQDFDLLLLLEYVTSYFIALTSRKGISIDILIDGRPVDKNDRFTVHGEEQLCHTMLANLIKNALEASPKDSPVTISLQAKEKAVVVIHNHGAVPKKVRDCFFDKFVTTGKKSGTGLGSYSARLMAETQQGNIHLQTSDAAGTTVTVTLLKGDNDALEKTAKTPIFENPDHR